MLKINYKEKYQLFILKSINELCNNETIIENLKEDHLKCRILFK